jgi:hypothetical protein
LCLAKPFIPGRSGQGNIPLIRVKYCATKRRRKKFQHDRMMGVGLSCQLQQIGK